MANLVVIFGAGASFDSVEDLLPNQVEQHRPPLTSALFSYAYRGHIAPYSQCMSLALDLRALEHGNDAPSVEAHLRRFVDGIDRRGQVQLSALRFYLRSVIANSTSAWLEGVGRGTNYVRLVDALRKWCDRTQSRVTYITFNYDTLLEDALRHERLWPENIGRNISDYIAREPQVVKLHGSIDWVHELTVSPWPDSQNDALKRMIDGYSEIEEAVRQSVHMVQGDGIHVAAHYHTEDRLFYPALSIPVDQKDLFECPDDHLRLARAALQAAHGVLTIGWRAGDTQFLNMWRDCQVSAGTTRPLLQAVCANEEDAVAAELNLKTSIAFEPVAGRAQGFSNYLRGGRPLREFLQQVAPG